jgi:hypothetical protein
MSDIEGTEAASVVRRLLLCYFGTTKINNNFDVVERCRHPLTVFFSNRVGPWGS